MEDFAQFIKVRRAEIAKFFPHEAIRREKLSSVEASNTIGLH